MSVESLGGLKSLSFEENLIPSGKRKCCPSVECTTQNKTMFAFVGLCLMALLILCCVYGLGQSSTNADQRSLSDVYAVGDAIFSRDLWLVVEFPSDVRGLRTRLGKQISQHVCNAIKAGQAMGWTPLVIGGKSPCCKSSRCRHLHPIDLEQMNHSVALHFWQERNDIRSALRSAGYLAAIKKGARFVFQANPEVYYMAGVDAKTYQAELEHQLHKMTLGISVGLVKETPEKHHFDPYAHFSPDHESRLRPKTEQEENQMDNSLHKYKICKIRPPSLEKFLDQDGFSVDDSAPSVTLPGQISPFDSRNTLFGREALWSLIILPITDHKDKENSTKKNNRDSFVIRSILSQAILAEIGGSTKFRIAKTPTSVHVKELMKFGPRVQSLLEYLNSWSCSRGSALICLDRLIKDLVDKKILEPEVSTIVGLWIRDLVEVGYDDISTIHRYPGYSSPCIGSEALNGVYFHPALTYRQTETGLNSHPKALSTTQMNRHLTAKAIQRLCPAFGVDNILQSKCETCENIKNILLIVTFNNKQYDSIPFFEVIYRHHFQNILYCGQPDTLIEHYIDQYNDLQGTHFSFLPTQSNTGYECLLGAIEMGYTVDGYLVKTHDTLLNAWNFGELDLETIWHGNEHNKIISTENIITLDPPNGENIIRSTKGILKAFEFLEDVLLKGPSAVEMTHHMRQDNQRSGKRLRRDTEEDSVDYELYKEDEQEMLEDQGIDSNMIPDRDRNNTMHNNLHISLFGEVIYDDDEDTDDQANVTDNPIKSNRSVSELLFHPANLVSSEDSSTEWDSDSMSNDFADMKLNIHLNYKRIVDKLSFWQTLTNVGRRNYNRKDSLLNEDLEHFQCDVSTNSEICQLVSGFFHVLQSNQGANFHIFHDNLPIYYIPASYQEKLYLMANLFIKYHVSDELAFPLLLRGLRHRDEWTNLKRSKVVPKQTNTKTQIEDIEDLLVVDDELAERDELLQELESGHYIHPVDTSKVLKNNNMRDVICRNF